MSVSIATVRCGCLLFLAATLAARFETCALAADAAEPAVESADEAESGDEAIKDQPATHRQTAIIRPATDNGSKLKAFVVTPDGNILALVQRGSAPGDEDEATEVLTLSTAEEPQAKEADGKKPARAVCQIRTFDPDGKRIGAWPVGFLAQTIGLGPDNCLYVAGSGRVARYSLAGVELASAESPQSVLIEKDRDALREAAEAQIEAEKENSKQMLVAYERQREALTARMDKMPDVARKQREAQLKQLDAQIKRLSPEERTVDRVMVEITERVKRINAIAASDKEVFITCPQTKGYGYSVWRTDLDFGDPKCIVTGLSGCCGQMDVCCAKGDLWVAENSRHRVVRYDREGKKLSAFGKTGRDGVGASFGGCCNPMNLCFDKAGDILVSESNGQVKHFTAKGKYLELAGVAGVQPGCKNSAVKISPDGEKIYYIDVNKSQILVLARAQEDEKAEK